MLEAVKTVALTAAGHMIAPDVPMPMAKMPVTKAAAVKPHVIQGWASAVAMVVAVSPPSHARSMKIGTAPKAMNKDKTLTDTSADFRAQMNSVAWKTPAT